MAFTPPQPKTPHSIPYFSITLKDRQEWLGEPEAQLASYSLKVVDENGVIIPFDKQSGDLIPHLTPGEISTIQAFMATLRSRAEDQILGTGV